MALPVGNLLGAVADLQTAFGGESSLKAFLQSVNKFGIQVKNNFEVNFSGVSDATFFITSIDLPGMHQNYTEVFFDGRRVDVPINHEYDHEFSITVLNDAQGYIYSALAQFIASDASNKLANSGYTMTVKALNGDNGHYPGSVITLNGVRLENLGQLTFGYSDNDVSTFTVSCKCVDFEVTPGALGQVAGVLGAATKLLG